MTFLRSILLLVLFALPILAQEGAGTGGGMPSSGFDASAMLDSTLGIGSGSGTAVADEDTGEGDGKPAGEGDAPDVETNEGEGEAETTEGDAEGEGAGEDAALEFDDEEIGKPTVVKGPNGENLYQWPENAARQIQSQVKFAAELQKAIPDLSVDDAIAHNEAYTDLYRFGADLRTGTADGLKRVGQTILNETGNTKAFGSLTNMMVDHVKKNLPQAYSQISSGVEAELESELYAAAQDAINNPNPNIREGYRILAEMFAFHRSGGKFTPVAEFKKNIDPLDQRLQRAEQLERQHQERTQQESVRVDKAWQGAASNESGRLLRETVEKAIPEQYQERFKKDPNLKTMVTNHVISQVRARLKADPEWSSRFEVEYGQARQERSRESVQRIVDRYVARAKGVLKRELRTMLSSASSDVVAQSQTRHEQLRTATGSSHRVPGGTGAPVRRSVAQKPGNFKTSDDYAKHVAELLS